tara:strand:+ start:315 stop:818 length:504 start_codon:yes stop_codon:yes gene_type:complete
MIEHMKLQEAVDVFTELCPHDINSSLRDDATKVKWSNTKKSNVQAQMSGWQTHTPSTKILTDWIIHIITTVTNTPYITYLVSDAWFAQYDQGDYTNDHCHYPLTWSFVYFVKSPPNSSPLVFTTTKYAVPPEENRVVIFPGCVRHHVPPNQSNGRLVYAGNLKILMP